MTPDPPYEQEETDLAAQEAGAIGGVAGEEALDPAERAVREGGGGESEGFEEADQQSAHAILHDAAGAEEDIPEREYGEGDREYSSERDVD